MKRALTVLSFLLLFLLLFSYFYLPSKSMSDLYQKIPEQVRRNSQLVAAYYHSQTGFNGFREYQFALYNPENKTLSVYTFKTYKLLKIWPRMKKSKITCKTPLDYSILATSPEKLKDFKDCDNCREFLYKGKVYRDEEIESIYPSLEQIVGSNRSTRYVKLSLVKSSELSTGAMVLASGDKMFSTDYVWHAHGLLYLPSSMKNLTRGIIVEFLPLNNETVKRIIHYPENVILNDTIRLSEYYRIPVSDNTTWTLKREVLANLTQVLNSQKVRKTIGTPTRFRFEISKWGTERLEAWVTWTDVGKGIYSEWRVYPAGKVYWRNSKFIREYRCG
ncbi:hypothetical protein A3L09_05545 [Thermococcus profundus]|uniref:Uncharacterized protein n=1 Tax=Thermococcus profundus TaxID=49899 RepID=A0A2Z2MDH5_THEPR|nr:hypothetical protein [Thermococcus profundus]ASJ02752.1 hypothetical protein A3L09_05545 [Thermococcus profundus]